jgi:hypothetical protein
MKFNPLLFESRLLNSPLIMNEDNEKDANSPVAVSGPSSAPSDHEEVEPPVVAFKTWIVALVKCRTCHTTLQFS